MALIKCPECKNSISNKAEMWYCVVLTGGATNGKHNKRTVARHTHSEGILPSEQM